MPEATLARSRNHMVGSRIRAVKNNANGKRIAAIRRNIVSFLCWLIDTLLLACCVVVESCDDVWINGCSLSRNMVNVTVHEAATKQARKRASWRRANARKSARITKTAFANTRVGRTRYCGSVVWLPICTFRPRQGS